MVIIEDPTVTEMQKNNKSVVPLLKCNVDLHPYPFLLNE